MQRYSYNVHIYIVFTRSFHSKKKADRGVGLNPLVSFFFTTTSTLSYSPFHSIRQFHCQMRIKQNMFVGNSCRKKSSRIRMQAAQHGRHDQED